MKKRKSNGKKRLFTSKKRITRLFMVIGVSVSVAVIGYGAYQARHIFEPVNTMASAGIERAETRDEKIMYWYVVNDENSITGAGLLILDGVEGKIKEIFLPPSTLVTVPYGVNELKISGLYKIGEYKNAEETSRLITQSLTQYFGVTANGIIGIKSNENITSISTWSKSLSNLIKTIFDSEWTDKTFITNKTRFELAKIILKTMQTPDDLIINYNIVDQAIGIDTTSSDGTNVIKTDQNKLNSLLRTIHSNAEIKNEKANVRVRNTTTVLGLASNFSRVLENSGVSVIEIGNTDDKVSTTEIHVSSKQWIESSTVQSIKTALDVESVQVKTTEGEDDEITVLIGKDYAKKVIGK